jgi:hypothetical protein
MFSQSRNLPIDVIGIILSFLGKEIYFNKYMKQLHIRFNRMNENVILNNLFLKMHYSIENFFQLNDSFEIFFNARKHSSMIIYFNEFKKHVCYPQNVLLGLDATMYCIMQLIDNVYQDEKCIYEKYTYFPVLKKEPSTDPKLKNNPLDLSVF